MTAIDINSIKLFDIDVGFSLSRPTTGFARSAGGITETVKAHTDWERHRVYIPAYA